MPALEFDCDVYDEVIRLHESYDRDTPKTTVVREIADTMGCDEDTMKKTLAKIRAKGIKLISRQGRQTNPDEQNFFANLLAKQNAE